MALKFYTSTREGLKLKVKKFLGITPTFVRYRRKTGRGIMESRIHMNITRTNIKNMLLANMVINQRILMINLVSHITGKYRDSVN